MNQGVVERMNQLTEKRPAFWRVKALLLLSQISRRDGLRRESWKKRRTLDYQPNFIHVLALLHKYTEIKPFAQQEEHLAVWCTLNWLAFDR